MTAIHLDSNFIAAVGIEGSLEAGMFAQWIISGSTVAVSAMAWAEFLCGPSPEQILTSITSVLGESVPVTTDDASHAARLFNATGRRRGSLADCIIAAVAIRSDAAIATNDLTHFRRFAEFGLRIAE
ncbi:MAG: type II toxin-antitoxin system VapC family toxin [Gemmatimonadota bacterium]|nr:type II toxin-antitoxin system VapC family toxin [Gemmatimonadota bacterium]